MKAKAQIQKAASFAAPKPQADVTTQTLAVEQPDVATQLASAARLGHSFAALGVGSSVPDPSQEDRTGLPDHLKAGLEHLSGLAMDDVRVHYNSPRPARLQALAYTQGSEIHVGPGQERHLPHEAWHAVQQKQGRVKPTVEMTGRVSLNDDAGLESEADEIGNMAVHVQDSAVAPRQRQALGRIVQRVKDVGKRSEIDERMDGLVEQTTSILAYLMQQGEDWEKLYGAKGKEKGEEKARDVMSGEETDYLAEIRRETLKRYWASLTTEEKVEMVTEAAGHIASASLKALDALLSSGGSEAKKSRDEPKQSGEKSGLAPSMGWISELTADDLQNLYDLYREKKKVMGKIEKLQNRVVEEAGKIGESIGKAVGRQKVEAEFRKHCNERRQDFMVARERYELLEAAIRENEDKPRYQAEMDALSDALFNINGPAMVYLLGELTEKGRSGYPDLCQIALGNLGDAHVKRAVSTKARKIWSAFTGAVGKAVETLLGTRDKEAEAAVLTNTQEEMADELTRVVGKSWSKYTSWGWTPKGVATIRKEMPQAETALEKLTRASKIAKDSVAMTSENRSPETQIFYDALARLKTDDLASVRMAISTMQEIGEKLG